MSIVWSPVNQAFLILFGSGPVATRSVLAICATRADAEARLADWSRA
jgi:hypothetical protein